MDDFADLFVKPVEGHEDTFAFRYGFTVAPEGKAADTIVTETDDGDLIIEGWAADFSGIDRQGENFTDGAFQKGIDEFLANSGSLCFHHKHDHGIGRVEELNEVEGKGLHMRARVTKQPESSPLYYIYNGIKQGDYKGLSVGGFFDRTITDDGLRINNVDFTEISVTPVPVNPRTTFQVLAGKALEDVKVPKAPKVEGEIREDDKYEIVEAISRLDSIFSRLAARGKTKKDRPTSAAEQTVEALTG